MFRFSFALKQNLGTPYSVQCKPNEHAVPYSADRGSGGDFFTVSGFLWKRGTLWKTKELAVRSQIIHILWYIHCPKSQERFLSLERDVTIKTTTGKKQFPSFCTLPQKKLFLHVPMLQYLATKEIFLYHQITHLLKINKCFHSYLFNGKRYLKNSNGSELRIKVL